MKTLGLLGGMSWESTAVYYQLLNRMTRDRLGGQHSARLLIWSADFAPLSDMMAASDWDGVKTVLIAAARGLETAGAQGLLVCSNTMHLMAPDIEAAIGIPLIHVADVTAAAVVQAGRRRPLILATRFTMEKPFYRERLARQGLEAVIPPQPDRERLHAIIFDELVQGRFEATSRQAVRDIVGRAVADQGVDSVILGCTEFDLLVGRDDFSVPVFDSTAAHAEAGLAFALAS